MDRDGMLRTRAWFAGTAALALLGIFLRLPFSPLAYLPPIAVLVLLGPHLAPVAIYFFGVRGKNWTIGCGLVLATFITLPWTLVALGGEPPPSGFMALGFAVAWLSVTAGALASGFSAVKRRRSTMRMT